MSDILEDQKIHYIVKDYRRMYNAHWTLKSVIEELQKSLKEKDKEILILMARVNELKNEQPKEQLPTGKLKGILNEIEAITNSINNKLQQSVSQSQKISSNMEEFREILKV